VRGGGGISKKRDAIALRAIYSGESCEEGRHQAPSNRLMKKKIREGGKNAAAADITTRRENSVFEGKKVSGGGGLVGESEVFSRSQRDP